MCSYINTFELQGLNGLNAEGCRFETQDRVIKFLEKKKMQLFNYTFAFPDEAKDNRSLYIQTCLLLHSSIFTNYIQKQKIIYIVKLNSM